MKNIHTVSVSLAVCFLLSIAIAHEAGADDILDVPQNYQEHSQWCWAAASQSILAYYDTSLTQTEIAQYGTDGSNTWNWIFGTTYNPTRRGIDAILEHFGGIASTGYSTSVSEDTVRAEIDGHRPIIIRWEWIGGDGHFVTAHGITNSMVYLRDSLAGPTINAYSWVLSGGGHSWTHTLVLTTDPMSTVATPVISPDGGEFTDPVTVALACATSGAEIRYTLNGSEPSTNSALYTAAFQLADSATVKAAGFRTNAFPSSVAAASFTRVARTVSFASADSMDAEHLSPQYIPVRVNTVSTQAVTVAYSRTDGTASGSDYLLSPGTLTFQPGVLTGSIMLTLNNDAQAESNETVVLSLSSPVRAGLSGPSNHTFRIIDNDSDFAAHNDLAWQAGQTNRNITTYGNSGATNGFLIDHATGDYAPAHVTISGGGTVADTVTAGPRPATDAWDIFDGIVDCNACIACAPAELTLVFTRLDPSRRYEFVLFSNRGEVSYIDRYATTTISDVSGFWNRSTAGSAIQTRFYPEDSSRIMCGFNTERGYVTRFRNIMTGSDGDLTVSVSSNSVKYYANAFMLRTCPADDDHDLMADSWEYEHFGRTNNPAGAANGDPDADGSGNADEYSAGTDPTNALSMLVLTDCAAWYQTNVVLRWLSVSGKNYAVLRSDGVTNTPVRILDRITATPPENVSTAATGAAGSAFYRILVR